MQKLVGWGLVALTVLFGGAGAFAPVAKDLSFFLQVLGPGVIGAGVLNFDKIKNALPKKKEEVAKDAPKVEDKAVENRPEPVFHTATLETRKSVIALEDEQQVDLECLNRIASRCKDNPEGLELVRKLHDVFFAIHHGVSNEKKS